jgi:predicted nuclease of predicted toxin-antitoxin system
MRLLVDANLSPRVTQRLRDASQDAVHVRDVGLRNALDPEILEYARSQHRVVLTADADFAMMLAARRAVGPSVIQLRSADHLTPDAQATS